MSRFQRLAIAATLDLAVFGVAWVAWALRRTAQAIEDAAEWQDQREQRFREQRVEERDGGVPCV